MKKENGPAHSIFLIPKHEDKMLENENKAK